MKILYSLSILFLALSTAAAEPPRADKPLVLSAPKEWRGEQIKLPPGFAPKMRLEGTEAIRFAPGMFQAGSDSFFSYVFVFAIDKGPELVQKEIQAEMLTYYRGLSAAVLGKDAAKVDFDKFRFTLTAAKSPNNKPAREHQAKRWTGRLDWVEPFATKKAQTLNMELSAWTCQRTKRNYLLVAVSPQQSGDKIWTQLRKIQEGFRCHSTE